MKYVFTLINLCLFMSFSLAQEKASDEEIIKLLTLSGADARIQSVYQNLLDAGEKYNNELQDSLFLEHYKSKVLEEGVSRLESGFIEIYRNSFSKNEVLALIKFYQSDLGKILVRRDSIIQKETINLGQETAEWIGTKLQNENLFNISISADCSRFKTGKFTYTSSLLGKEIIVTRYEDYQVESLYGIDTKLKIEWISNNQYKLYKNIGSEHEENWIIIECTIYEVIGNTYKYISKSNIVDVFDRGTFTKIE